MTQTARIYGDSLYELAKEEGLDEAVFEQLGEVERIFAENPEYRRLLAEPSVPKKERVGLLDEAFGSGLEAYLLNFLKILCENGLLSELEGCREAYRERYYRDHGIAVATVSAAVALTPRQAENLKKKLEEISGKRVMLEQRLCPSLIGGLRIEMEGKQIDGTVAGRLSRLREKLGEALP